jgi:tRNA threonylcarbamoyladenosine biosynthesis protein TsaB
LINPGTSTIVAAMNGVILAIESSGDGGGAAVVRGGKVIAEAEVSGPRRHGSELMPCIDNALTDSKLKREEIDVIAVNCGPGSYTGLRIGIAAADAIGYALDKPVIGVDALEAMALQYVMRSAFDAKSKGELWPVLDARRDEVMTTRMQYAKKDLSRAGDDSLVAPESLHLQAEQQAIVFGSGVLPYKDLFNREHLHVDDADFVLRPSSVAIQAWRQLSGIKDAAKIERKRIEPLYFRRVLARTIEERQSAEKTDTPGSTGK